MKKNLLALAMLSLVSSFAAAEGVEYRFAKSESFEPAKYKSIKIESVGPMAMVHIFVEKKDGTTPISCAVPFTGWIKDTFGDPVGMADFLALNQYQGKIQITHFQSKVMINTEKKFGVKDYAGVNGTHGVGYCEISYNVTAK